MFTIVIVSVLCAYLVYRYLLCFDYWKNKNVPFIPPHWLFGNFKDFLISRGNIESFNDMYKFFEDEKFVGFYKGPFPELMIRDPDLFKFILKTEFQNFSARFPETNNDVFFGNLFTYTAEKWKPVRQKLTPVFTPNRLKAMFPLIYEKGNELIDVIRETELKNDNTNIRDLMAKYTTDVIGSTIFGIKMNSMLDDNNHFRVIGREIFDGNLWQNWRYIIKFGFPILSDTLRFKLISKNTENFFIKTIKDIISQKGNTNIKRNDLIDIFIEIQERQKSEKFDNCDKNFHDDTFLAAQAFSFFLAGFETTSSTMTYALHELAYNPKIQSKVREEIEEVLKETDGKITYDSIQKMTYLDMVLCETLRKYPVVHLIGRVCNKTCKLPDTNIYIDKGVTLCIPIRSIHWDPKYYPEPMAFIPERFTPEARNKRHPMTYMPFGEGPRKCLGYRMADIQGKVGLISILRNYEVKPCPKSQRELILYTKFIVMESVTGVWLKFTKIL